MIIDILLYLLGGTQHDVEYMVHQFTQFFACAQIQSRCCSQKYHINLQGARTNGFVMKYNKDSMKLDLLGDANFSGIFAKDDQYDHISVQSSTRLLPNFGGFHITSSYKLKTEIAMSTLEIKYIELS